MLMMYVQVLDAKLYTVWMSDYDARYRLYKHMTERTYNEPGIIINNC